MQFPQNVVGVQQCSRYSINSKTRHGSYILPRYAWSGCSKYSWVHVQMTKKQASTVDRPPPPLEIDVKKNHTVNYFCVTKTHRQQLSRVTSPPRRHRPDTPPESNDSCSQCWFLQQFDETQQLCRVRTRFAEGLYTQTQHCKQLIARV